MLNFTYGERASEKLAGTMREMFIGAARRLIANLTLDQCLMNRKEALASFLMQEIAPVVAGSGRIEDTAEQGWGVIIDTIEIQDVKILSESVFRHLQAPYRAEIAMKAELADLERGQKVSETRSLTERQAAEAVIQTQRETRILKARAEADAAEREAAEQLRAEQAKSRAAADELDRRDALAKKKILFDEGVALRQAESKAALDTKNLQIRLEAELQQLRLLEQKRVAAAQAELSTLATEVELAEQSHRAELRKLELDAARKQMAQQVSLSLAQQKSTFDQEQRRREAETKRIEAETDAAQQRALAEIEQIVNQGRALREMITQGLPHIASAFRQSFGTINYTQLAGGDEGGPLNLVGQAIGQVLSVAKTFGLDPTRLSQPPSPAAPPAQPPRQDEGAQPPR